MTEAGGPAAKTRLIVAGTTTAGGIGEKTRRSGRILRSGRPDDQHGDREHDSCEAQA
jgi:hypothetical protein